MFAIQWLGIMMVMLKFGCGGDDDIAEKEEETENKDCYDNGRLTVKFQ